LHLFEYSLLSGHYACAFYLLPPRARLLLPQGRRLPAQLHRELSILPQRLQPLRPVVNCLRSQEISYERELFMPIWSY
jgi:hypothetical protein